MRLSKAEFESLVPKEGSVICSIPSLYEGLTGVGLDDSVAWIAADESRFQLCTRSGVIHKISDKPSPEYFKYNYTGPVQACVGNKVWWHANTMMNATMEPDDFFIEVDGIGLFLNIQYNELTAKLSSGSLVGLNDFIVARPFKTTGFILGSDDDDEYGKVHEVIAAPEPGVCYLDQGGIRKHYPVNVESGEIVVTSRKTINQMESESHRSMSGDIIVFQSKLVSMKLVSDYV
jgi:hypothetical protein